MSLASKRQEHTEHIVVLTNIVFLALFLTNIVFLAPHVFLRNIVLLAPCPANAYQCLQNVYK